MRIGERRPRRAIPAGPVRSDARRADHHPGLHLRVLGNADRALKPGFLSFGTNKIGAVPIAAIVMLAGFVVMGVFLTAHRLDGR